MLLVDAGTKGMSVKLHPKEDHRVFMDATDDGKSVVVVTGRVVRVDKPSSDMYRELTNLAYGEGQDKHSLLVETDEDPTPLPVVNKGITPAQPVDLNTVAALAAQHGFQLVPIAAGPEASASAADTTGGDVTTTGTGAGDDGKGSASSSTSKKSS